MTLPGDVGGGYIDPGNSAVFHDLNSSFKQIYDTLKPDESVNPLKTPRPTDQTASLPPNLSLETMESVLSAFETDKRLSHDPQQLRFGVQWRTAEAAARCAWRRRRPRLNTHARPSPLDRLQANADAAGERPCRQQCRHVLAAKLALSRPGHVVQHAAAEQLRAGQRTQPCTSVACCSV